MSENLAETVKLQEATISVLKTGTEILEQRVETVTAELTETKLKYVDLARNYMRLEARCQLLESMLEQAGEEIVELGTDYNELVDHHTEATRLLVGELFKVLDETAVSKASKAKAARRKSVLASLLDNLPGGCEVLNESL
jgi:chromosome segregation ATPase